MSQTHFDGFSAEQREHARSALVGAFGRAPIDAITPVTGGASTASTFRVDTGGRRYVFRVEGEPSPLLNPHQYVSMRIAAEAGIAPENPHPDEVPPIAAIDFIGPKTLQYYPASPRQP